MKLKQRLVYLSAFIILNISAHASQPGHAALKMDSAQSLRDPVPPKQAEQIIKMKWFVKMTTEEYGKLRGKKLNFLERISFKMSQHRMKKMLQQYDYGEPSIFQKISWLLKGLILGPIALLLVYLFANDEEQELIQWTWFGFAGWVVWVGILVYLLLVH